MTSRTHLNELAELEARAIARREGAPHTSRVHCSGAEEDLDLCIALAQKLEDWRVALRDALKAAAACPALDDGWAAYELVHFTLAASEAYEQNRR